MGSRALGSQPSSRLRVPVATSFVGSSHDSVAVSALPRLLAVRSRFRFGSVRLGLILSHFLLLCICPQLLHPCPTLVVRIGWSPGPARAGTCRATAGSEFFGGRDGSDPASRDVSRSGRPSSLGMLRRRRWTRGPGARALGSPGLARSVPTPWSLQRRFYCVRGFCAALPMGQGRSPWLT